MLRKVIQNVRIWFAFWSYNDVARKEWRKAAEEEFSTEELKSDLNTRVWELDADVARRYGIEMTRLEKALAEARRKQSDVESKLPYFEIDYRRELERAYGRLNEIKNEQARCRDALKESYSDLESAKDGIDRWYAKSERNEVFFGNRDRKLPKHSMFGQSFGDLDSLKSDRDSAGSAIGTHKAKRERLNAESDEVRQTIERLKRDRDIWFKLKQEGHGHSSLLRLIEIARKSVADGEVQIRAQQDRQNRYVASEQESRGIKLLWNKIAEAERRQARVIKQFDDPAEIAKRKAVHRAEWLRLREGRS